VFSVQENGAPWSARVSRAEPSPGVQVRSTMVSIRWSQQHGYVCFVRGVRVRRGKQRQRNRRNQARREATIDLPW